MNEKGSAQPNAALKILGYAGVIIYIFVVIIIVGGFFSAAPIFKKAVGIPWFWLLPGLATAFLVWEGHSKTLTVLEKVLWVLGRISSMLLLFLVCVISFEVIMRYAFNSPTTWAWILNLHVWLVTMLCAGVFAFQEGSHIRIEVIYDSFPYKFRVFVKYLTLFLFWVFAVSLVWKGYFMAASSVTGGEIARGPFPMPIYPFKIMVPLVALLLLVQGTSFILKQDVSAVKPQNVFEGIIDEVSEELVEEHVIAPQNAPGKDGALAQNPE